MHHVSEWLLATHVNKQWSYYWSQAGAHHTMVLLGVVVIDGTGSGWFMSAVIVALQCE